LTKVSKFVIKDLINIRELRKRGLKIKTLITGNNKVIVVWDAGFIPSIKDVEILKEIITLRYQIDKEKLNKEEIDLLVKKLKYNNIEEL